MSYSKRDLTKFTPSANPLRTFSSPIQQIISAMPVPGDRAETIIAIRTAGGIILLDVQPKPNLLLGISSRELASFTRSDSGDRLLVDMAFNNLFGTTFIAANDRGDIFQNRVWDEDSKM
jgi:hypothetical protein